MRGNQTAKGTQAYTFDAANRLTAVPGLVTMYSYDAHGRRVGEIDGGGGKYAMYTRDGVMRGEFDGATHTAHVYLGTQLIASQKSNAAGALSVTYHHADALGSPVVETDTAWPPGIVQSIFYRPYGAASRSDGGIVDGPGYTGHIMDGPTGLVYMQQRYYDPGIGRFLSVDPMGVDTGTGWNFNRYNYAANNPYSFLDPDGRCGTRIGGQSSASCKSFDLTAPRENSSRDAVPVSDSLSNQREHAYSVLDNAPSVDGAKELTYGELGVVLDFEIAHIDARAALRGGYENLSAMEFGWEAYDAGDSIFFGPEYGGEYFRVVGGPPGLVGPFVGGDLNYLKQGLIFGARGASGFQLNGAVMSWNVYGGGTLSHTGVRLYLANIGYDYWNSRP